MDPSIDTETRVRSGDMLKADALVDPAVSCVYIKGAALTKLSEELAPVFLIPPADPYLIDTLDIRVLFEFTTAAGNKYLLSWRPNWETEWINVPVKTPEKAMINKLLKFLPAVFYDRVLDVRAGRF